MLRGELLDGGVICGLPKEIDRDDSARFQSCLYGRVQTRPEGAGVQIEGIRVDVNEYGCGTQNSDRLRGCRIGKCGAKHRVSRGDVFRHQRNEKSVRST